MGQCHHHSELVPQLRLLVSDLLLYYSPLLLNRLGHNGPYSPQSQTHSEEEHRGFCVTLPIYIKICGHLAFKRSISNDYIFSTHPNPNLYKIFSSSIDLTTLTCLWSYPARGFDSVCEDTCLKDCCWETEQIGTRPPVKPSPGADQSWRQRLAVALLTHP